MLEATMRWAERRSISGFLNAIAGLWFVIALSGQCLFVYYLTVAYATPTLRGDYAAWNRTQPIVGHVAGDGLGNLMFVSHVLLAMVIALGGMLQLVPQVRRYWPALHRWNGRLFLSVAVLMAVGGTWMVWWRGAQLSLPGALGISLNALLILLFSAFAIGAIRRRDLALHRRWALRAFMVINGVWFYRLGFMAWILLNQGPRGSTPQLDGPFDMIWAFGSYLLPLAGLELYFWAQRRPNTAVGGVLVGVLMALTALTALGVFGAYVLLWRPHL